MDETRICSHCGCVLEEDEGTELDDDLLCDDCMHSKQRMQNENIRERCAHFGSHSSVVFRDRIIL